MKFGHLFEHLRSYLFTSAGRRSLHGLFRDYRCVRRSPLFDGAWYLSENPDVSRGGTYSIVHRFLPGTRYAALHFLLEGGRGRRDPSPGFCCGEYAALNGVDPAEINPLVHYERFGRKNGVPVSFLPTAPVSRDEALGRLREKAASGKRIRTLFFVTHPAMFPARPLFEAMCSDPRFDARIAVVPDLRWGEAAALSGMERCAADLRAWCHGDRIVVAEKDVGGLWQDLVADADLVCHASPYNLSDFHYNPRWCAGRPVLAFHVNYGYFRSFFDREIVHHWNYACFWKVFSECEENLGEYRAHAVDGTNAVVSGYVKMDRLAPFLVRSRPAGRRKRVLIAPHHSVEGGLNDKLALSNFLRYADYFRELPRRHPEIDFLFRPHPFLFTALRESRFWGDAKVDAWIAGVKAEPNVVWIDAGDYFPAFGAADAIVQDCGSWLMEWMYTGKPCCYLLKQPSDIEEKFTPIGRAALGQCDIAYHPEQVEAFLRDVVIGGSDAKKASREAFRRRIAVNWPHAADVALSDIKHALGL